MSQSLTDTNHVKDLLNKVKDNTPRKIKIMEVCGTHTHAISRFSFRQTLGSHVDFVSGPGCPVCVTAQADIDKMIAFARLPDTIITTFGDMMRVPGSTATLNHVKAEGADIRVVFSPLESLVIAQKNHEKEVIFLGVGFETTAPIVAASIKEAQKQNIPNYSVLSFHKTIPEALAVLFSQEHKIDGLLLPGHVSAVLGLGAFQFLIDQFALPSVVAGFTPVDILIAVLAISEMIKTGHPRLLNAYERVVRPQGNALARQEISHVFTATDSIWRGLGSILKSGLSIRPEFIDWDAQAKFSPTIEDPVLFADCRCGSVIMGQIRPDQCPLFKTECTPRSPQGPCMVSGEGACSAYFNYDRYSLSKEAKQ